MAPHKPKKNKNYDQSTLLSAIASVKNGMTYKEAYVKYGIPISTLNDKCRGRYSEGKDRPGLLISFVMCNIYIYLAFYIMP